MPDKMSELPPLSCTLEFEEGFLHLEGCPHGYDVGLMFGGEGLYGTVHRDARGTVVFRDVYGFPLPEDFSVSLNEPETILTRLQEARKTGSGIRETLDLASETLCLAVARWDPQDTRIARWRSDAKHPERVVLDADYLGRFPMTALNDLALLGYAMGRNHFDGSHVRTPRYVM